MNIILPLWTWVYIGDKLISEVKQGLMLLVLGWVTAWLLLLLLYLKNLTNPHTHRHNSRAQSRPILWMGPTEKYNPKQMK